MCIKSSLQGEGRGRVTDLTNEVSIGELVQLCSINYHFI
jgi:hypothetical protein